MFHKFFILLKKINKNKFYFFFFLFLVEGYYYLKYIRFYNYLNNLQIKHKKMPFTCIKWLMKSIKKQPNKRLFLNNLYTKELSNDDIIYKSDVKEFIYSNLLLKNKSSLKEYDKNIFIQFYDIFKNNIVDDNENIKQDNKSNKIINYSNDSLTSIYKPIIIYGLIKSYRFVKMMEMRFKGYEFDKFNGINIIFNLKKNNKIPILFFHGLGFGFVPYLYFFENSNIIAPEIPNLSNSNFTLDTFSLDIYVKSIIKWLKKKNIYEIDIMGHSFGTIILNYMLGYHKIINPPLLIKIRKKIYLEPICFNCFSSSIHRVCYSNYKWNFDRKFTSNIKKLLFYYIIQKDIYIQATMKRFINPFEIFEYNIKMNQNTCILLSGRDFIIKSEYLKDYIKKYWRKNVKLIYNENESHGSILISKNKHKIKKEIFDFIG